MPGLLRCVVESSQGYGDYGSIRRKLLGKPFTVRCLGRFEKYRELSLLSTSNSHLKLIRSFTNGRVRTKDGNIAKLHS